MSCFLVDKASFARVAGIVAGIAHMANQSRSDSFWLYDLKKNRNMNSEDYLESFYKVYELNRKSVSESWGEEQKPDKKIYKGDFQKGLALGKKLYYHRWENGAYLRTIQELRHFFASVRYQIDNPAMERAASNFMNAVMVRLIAQLNTDEHDCWGSFQLEDIEAIITDEESKTKQYVSRVLGLEGK